MEAKASVLVEKAMRIASTGGAGSAAAAGRASAGAGDGPLAPAAGGGVLRVAQASASSANSTSPARAYRRLGDVIGAAAPYPIGRGKLYPGTLSEIGCRVLGTAGAGSTSRAGVTPEG